MNIIIGISWPFANGELHIGHTASSLPGDVIARYHRLKGDKVILVSGTDCHGTPTEVKALQENKSPKEIVDDCHVSFSKDFKDFGISFDLYNRTDDPYHKEFVQEQFVKYYNNGYLEEKEEEQLYCDNCKLFLADRYIIGICPKCGAEIKGDECEKCGSLLTIDEVKETKCAICDNKASYKKNRNLYFKLSIFQDNIKELLDSKRNDWRGNAVNFTERYLKEGIPDRCASRTLNYGIDIPIDGFKDKKLYGWFENVWGYVTASKKYAEENGITIKQTKVGYRYVLEEMLKNGYNIGGEQSGHVILLDYNPTGDGILTSLMLIRVMLESNKSASELCKIIKMYPQVLVNAKIDPKKKKDYETDDEIQTEIRKLEEEFSGNGRVLIRPSGTEPLIRVMLEGEDKAYLKEKAENLAQLIEKKLK